MSGHATTLLNSCASVLYALRTLRAHGMRQDCLHEVFRFTVLAKLYMQVQLGRVSVLQATSTNSTDSSTDANLSTTASSSSSSRALLDAGKKQQNTIIK